MQGIGFVEDPSQLWKAVKNYLEVINMFLFGASRQNLQPEHNPFYDLQRCLIKTNWWSQTIRRMRDSES